MINVDCYSFGKSDDIAELDLIQSCRDQLDKTGSCLLPDFLTKASQQQALDDALDKISAAHQVNHEFAYDDVDDNTLAVSLKSLPENHPRHHKSLTKIRFLARDLLSPSNPLLMLHSDPLLCRFISQVMDKEIYPSACPLSSCVVTVAEEGELQDWHFDGADFIVTIMLEQANSGGDFEYVKGLRSADGSDDFAAISNVFKGDREGVIVPAIEPGTLTLFKGRFNLHRAAPVDAGSRRVMAVLSFETQPNKTGTDAFLKLFYGRNLADLPKQKRLVKFA